MLRHRSSVRPVQKEDRIEECNAVLKWHQFQDWGMHNLRYGSPRRKAVTVGEAAGAAACVLTLAGIWKLARRVAGA